MPARCWSRATASRASTRGGRPAPVAGVTVIDGAGATLMPGMCEAHTHFSWNNAATLDAIQRMPLEEHMLLVRPSARRYLDSGWTSCVGAASAKPRLDVVIRNAINAGQIPGPRYLAASQEITVARRRSATTPCRTCRSRSSASAWRSAGPRRCARRCALFLKYGVDSIKLNLSGDNFVPQSPTPRPPG